MHFYPFFSKDIIYYLSSITSYSRVRNKRTPTIINFWNFFQGLWSYYGLKRHKFYYISLHILRGYVYYFCQIFQRLRLFKGLRLFQTLEHSGYLYYIDGYKKQNRSSQTTVIGIKITTLKNAIEWHRSLTSEMVGTLVKFH